MRDHIAKFEDLVCLSGTQLNEAYIDFFNSLPRTYKGTFAERFLTSQPLDRLGSACMHPANDYARTL